MCNSRLLALALQIATPPAVGPTYSYNIAVYWLFASNSCNSSAVNWATVTKGIANVSNVVQKSPNIVAWAQHKTNIDMDTWIW